MTKIPGILKIVAAALLLAPVTALAVETNGTIKGRITDTSGTALPGITVTVASDALIGGPRTSVTSEEGFYRFPALPVGTYSVKAEHEGFQKAESRTYLGIGAEVVVDFKMQIPTAEETFVINDVRPVVDTEKTSSGATLDSEFLSKIPSGRTYQGVTQFVAGVTGGGNPNVHGETSQSNSYLLDGVNITDPVTHTFSTNFNFDAIDAIEVITGGYDAEYGQATGAIVNIVTKSGGNELTVDTSAYYADFNLVSGGQRDVGKFQDTQANLNVGGPILKDKIWFFTSYEFNRNVVQPFERRNPTTQQSIADPQIFQGHYFLGKITYQLNPSNKLTFQAQTDPTTISNIGGDNTVFADAQTLREQGGANYSLSWDWVLSGSTLLRTQVGYVDGVLNEVPQDRDFTTAAHLSAEGDITHNPTVSQWDYRRRLVLGSKVTHFVDDFYGNHRLGAGIDVHRDSNPYIVGFNGDTVYVDGGYQTDSNGDIIFDDDGNPVSAPGLKYEFDGTNRTVTRGYLVGLWLQENWNVTPNLLFKIGGRFDHSEYQNDVGQQILNLTAFSPRLWVAWDPTHDKKTQLHAGYAQSADTGMLLIPYFVNRKNITGRIYEWDGAQYSYAGDYGEAEGYDVKKMRTPIKHEVQLGFQREVASNFALGGKLIMSRSQYYFEDDETNLIWNADGSDAIGFKDGRDHYVYSLGTPANSYRDYRGIELTFTKAMSNGWLMDGSYTLGDARGTNSTSISYFADNPVQDQYLRDSELPYNVANALKIQTTKELPYGFTLGAAYFFETGNPYDRLYNNPYYARANGAASSFSDYREKPGQFHYEPFQRIDIRAQYSRKVGARNNLTVVADVFNILDTRVVTLRDTRYIPEEADNSPSQPFGRVLDKQDPLRAQLGVRYNF